MDIRSILYDQIESSCVIPQRLLFKSAHRRAELALPIITKAIIDLEFPATGGTLYWWQSWPDECD